MTMYENERAGVEQSDESTENLRGRHRSRPASRKTQGDAETSDLPSRISTLSKRMSTDMIKLLKLIGKAEYDRVWMEAGALTCASWLAELCEIELSTARTQIRVARAMREHEQLLVAMESGDISYAKARILVPALTPENAEALVSLASTTPVRGLGAAIAAWANRNEDPKTIEERQHEERSVSWRTDADGMVTLTARLEPAVAATLCALVDKGVMGPDAPAGASLRQQRADSLHRLITAGGGVEAEVVIHVTQDGNRLADGTPLSDNAVTRLLPDAFVSLLVHDMQRQPIDASPRRRFPTRRQRRVIDEIDKECREPGCSTTTFLQYDHIEPYSAGGQTVLSNIRRLCGVHNWDHWLEFQQKCHEQESGGDDM